MWIALPKIHAKITFGKRTSPPDGTFYTTRILE